jgi:hypothetical protein
MGVRLMKVNVRYGTVLRMFELCKKHKKGEMDRSELEEILNHEDYLVEFERYNSPGLPMCVITREEFIEYFMNLLRIDVNDIKNQRLKMNHEYYRHFFDNLEYYEEEFNKLVPMLSREIFYEWLQYTIDGLPEEITFDELEFLFTISIGNSFGWPHKHYIHFDIIKFFKVFDKEAFRNFIGHEVHHIGLNKFFDLIDDSKISPEEYLYLFLAFEGLAVKYCNNGQGVLTRSIYPEQSNIGMDKFSWDYFHGEFDEMFENFKSQIYSIRENKIKGMEELQPILSKYWLDLYTKEQDRNEVPKLKHSKNYYFGCDIWGLIHDVYGKEMVYDTLKDLKKFPEVFNASLKKIGRDDLCI